MKRQLRTLTRSAAMAMLVGVAGQAIAAHDGSRNTYFIDAPVVASEPIVATRVERTPRETCRPVERRVAYRGRGHDHHDHGGDGLSTLAGGLIGGAIGRQFGGGSGRDAMTLIGAFTGAAIAGANSDRRHHDHDRRYVKRVEQHCKIVEEIREYEVVEGWNVTYLYQGREFTRRTTERPGSHIRLRVEVEPVMDSYERRIAGTTGSRYM